MIMEYFYNPYIVVVIFVLFLMFYFVYLDVEGSFANGFLHFGPGGDNSNTTQFMGVTLDSWSKVFTLYFVPNWLITPARDTCLCYRFGTQGSGKRL